MTVHNLVAHSVPLAGMHLIEASAGTGKTYNITRLYLRLLLERELTVQQILVMTFTKAATEEIRGRIDAFLRETLNSWDSWVIEDPFFKQLAQHIEKARALILIKQALLFLDEAAIFTIHGFCQRILTQHAFATNVPFNAQLDSDGREIELSACRDWYRMLAIEDQEAFLRLSEICASPESFWQQFIKAVRYEGEIQVRSEDEIIQEFDILLTKAERDLHNHEALLTECLIDAKTGKERQKRIEEKQALVDWLISAKENYDVLSTTFPDAFIDGRRYSRHKRKLEIIEALANVNLLKSGLKYLSANVARAKAMQVVFNGLSIVKAAIEEGKQRENILTFDDLIATLAERLQNADLAKTIYQQFPAALVDEFQDTDPQQYAILQAIYGNQPQACLFMIGDPKQAIYGFRGGDVFAYLAARNACDYQWIMDTNWRSSEAMISGYNRLFYGNSLAGESRSVFGYGIPYIPVNASPVASKQASLDNTFQALQFIHFENEDDKTVKQSFRVPMARWCANEINRLLSLPDIQASDIAILVRDGTEGETIKHALSEVNLASVYLSNRANLFDSEQAHQLLLVLNAVLYVEDEQAFTAALSTELLGITPDKLVALQQDEIAWQTLKFDFLALRGVWQSKSFITMALKLMHDHINVSPINADRELTNVLHLFEVLQSASQRHHQPAELLHWFETECHAQSQLSEAELRLESEDNLIRIITQHGSKGLEYPFVFVPFCTRHKDPLKLGNKHHAVIEFHDENNSLVYSLDACAEKKSRMSEEQYAESVRLLYVAVTRAKQRCYLMTAEFENFVSSPLGKTLLLAKEDCLANQLQTMSIEMPEAIGYHVINQQMLESSTEQLTETDTDKSAEQLPYSPARFTGCIERDWWLSSYTALNRNLRHVGISSPERDSEEVVLTQQVNELIVESAVVQFMLARGANVGNFLHDIMENLDFTQPDWEDALFWPMKKFGRFIGTVEHKQIISWLEKIIHDTLTPLPDLTLSTLSSSRLFKEIEFYFPMKSANTKAITHLLSKHREANRPYDINQATHVSLPSLKHLKGMMHGFIDLIFEYEGKFYVCDYKSNFLGSDIKLYQPNLLREDIELHNYDLQYLIYSLALHRYLKLNVNDYNVSEHFGGVYYLYLRGMGHVNAPKGSGVYFRSIDEATLNALDKIFDGNVLDYRRVESPCQN